MGTPHNGVLYTFLMALGELPVEKPKKNKILTHTWGFQHCSFRQIGQMREPRHVERAKVWLHVLFSLVYNSKYFMPLGGRGFT